MYTIELKNTRKIQCDDIDFDYDPHFNNGQQMVFPIHVNWKTDAREVIEPINVNRIKFISSDTDKWTVFFQ